MGIAKRLNSIGGVLWSILFCSLAALQVSASTLRVPEEYSTIQSAINAAVDFDTVLINDGTYTGDGNRDIDFLGKAIVVKSVNGAASTIIDCQADSLNPHRGFIFHSGEDSLSVLQGLTIQNGYAPGNFDSTQCNGGGILCDSGSSPIIRECVITQNWALNAGGGVAIFYSSPKLRHCTISYNTAFNFSEFAIAAYGGGVVTQSSSAMLTQCELYNNVAPVGGGLSCQYDSTIIDTCRIRNNFAVVLSGVEPWAAGLGGGIHLSFSVTELNYCEIYKNSAQTLFGFLVDEGKGGGIIALNSEVKLKNCNIVFNVAEGWPTFFNGTGAGILCANNSSILAEQCIIAFNEQAEGILITSSSNVELQCSNIFGNEYGDWIPPLDSQLNVNNNFSSDPQFCDPISDDFAISLNSPCSDSLSLCGTLIGVHDVGCISTDIKDHPEPSILPASITLYQNYPNPFNAVTTISFDSLTKSPFTLNIFNVLGETVYRLDGIAAPGVNSFVWNADDIASGIYFYSLKLNGNEQTRKMLLLK